jgi:iron only hydrogenase large subunit-like protein
MDTKKKENIGNFYRDGRLYTQEVIKKRMKAIYRGDKKLPIRKSHENPVVQKIYKEFLDKPLSEKAEKVLHTKYKKRSPF